MSKLPNHGLWARATTSAAAASSSSGRTVSALAKPHAQNVSHLRAWQGHHAQASTTASSSTSSTQQVVLSPQEASRIAALGGVSAPYYGPQPAAVVVALEQPHSGTNDGALVSMSLQSLATSFATLHAATLSSSQLVAPSAIRHPFTSANQNILAPFPTRAPQIWAHGYRSSATSSSSAYAAMQSGESLQSKLTLPSASVYGPATKDWRAQRRPHRVRLPNDKGKAAQQSSATIDAEIERVEEFFTSLWFSAQNQSAIDTRRAIEASNLHADSVGSRSPSPQGSRPGAEVGPRGLRQNVREPPPKFAVTTSAESSLSSSTKAGHGANTSANAGNSLAACNTVSMSSSSAGSALPHDATGTDHWARHFNIPRSYKRHDFMFEHGAYGIPKRHPLSSIRKASLPSASGNSDATEGRAPRRDQVPSSRVQAAQDMLVAAADFLAGSQRSSSSDLYCPTNGQDALRAAFSGGSTADGRELRSDMFSSRPGARRRANKSPHRMTIRGTDGRIIKDRLRSVQVGEDAYFLRPDSLGVADGVGGWASRPGADPALFSRLLMHFCAVELSRYDGVSASDLAADEGSMLRAWASVDPVEVMHRAWERCVRASRREGILGSSTALIALLRGDELRIANMGDCVLMIVRGGEMIFRSTEQQHSFNFPVQLGMMGDTTESLKKHASGERAVAEGEVSGAPASTSDNTEHLEDYDDVEDDHNAELRDLNALPPGVSNGAEENPANRDEDSDPAWDEPRRDAGRWTVRVEAGDIIVVGSDGLMDNLFDEDIMEEVVRFLPRNGSGQPDQDLLRSAEGNSAGGLSLSSSSSDSTSDASRFSPQLVSEALCSRAKAVSEDSRAISSPFQQRAMEEGLNYVGGKHDDISVLVCLVGERDVLDAEQSSPSPSDGAGQDAAPAPQSL